jgi:hypothetical protein
MEGSGTQVRWVGSMVRERWVSATGEAIHTSIRVPGARLQYDTLLRTCDSWCLVSRWEWTVVKSYIGRGVAQNVWEVVPNTKPDHGRVDFAWLLKHLYAVRFDQVPCDMGVERRQSNPEIVASSSSRVERHLA